MTIEQKVEQMYKALADLQVTERLSSLKPEVKRVGKEFYASFDFTKGTDRATAANGVSSLLANIACLKDHLRTWCDKNGNPRRLETCKSALDRGRAGASVDTMKRLLLRVLWGCEIE